MPAPAGRSAGPEEARTILAAFVEQHRLPGLSIAVVERDGPLFIAGVGRRNLTTGAAGDARDHLPVVLAHEDRHRHRRGPPRRG